MSTSNLRDKLREYAESREKDHWRRHSAALAVFESLVEAVEPEEHTCGECQSFHTKYPEFCIVLGVDARDPACERFVAWVEPEDTDARYAGCKTNDERTIVRLAYELAEVIQLFANGHYWCDCPWGSIYPHTDDLCAHALAVQLTVAREKVNARA